uniref:Transcription termination factor Rho n=2 Tax=Panagrellus redivivus TaxID=6233 RepID=A0A7E4VJH5_PANRE
MASFKSGHKSKGQGKYERMGQRLDQLRPLEEYRAALENFKIPDRAELARPRYKCSTHPDPIIDDYFRAVGATGVPIFKWDLVKEPLLWKLETILDDMVHVEDEFKPQVYMDRKLSRSELLDLKDFIMDKAKSFENAPFTIQRLCELLAYPTTHYRMAEKFYRAVEKNINVVMEITEDGKRLTGITEDPTAFDDDGTSSVCEAEDHIEKHFLVCVDEVDKPLEEQRASMERSPGPSGSSPSPSRHFHLMNNIEMPERPETPPPNEEMLKFAERELYYNGSPSKIDKSLEPLFAAIERSAQDEAAKKRSTVVDPGLDMFADDEAEIEESHSPVKSSDSPFRAPLDPVRKPKAASPQPVQSASGDAGEAMDTSESEKVEKPVETEAEIASDAKSESNDIADAAEPETKSNGNSGDNESMDH